MSIQVYCLASGSKANCFILDNGVHQIILDIGIAYKEILKKDVSIFDIYRIEACIVGHHHKDHSRGLQSILESGLPCYVSQTTKDESKLDRHNLNIYKNLNYFNVGTWNILPFNLKHDVENYGFMCMDSTSDDILVYVTDTMYCKYKISNVTHWLLECNYCRETIDKNLEYETLSPELRTRIMFNHMSLDTVKSMLLANDLSKTQKIYLMHLSDKNSDEERMKREIGEISEKEVVIF